MKIKLIIACVVSLILMALYLIFQDNLPPRTPLKIARKLSGLPLTNDYKILSFNEEWNDFNGDGSLRIEIEITDAQLAQLTAEFEKQGYQNLPIRNPPPEIDGALFLKEIVGLYKIRIYDQSRSAFDLVILDVKAKKLIVLVFVS